MSLRSSLLTLMTIAILGIFGSSAWAQLDTPTVERSYLSYSDAELKSFAQAFSELRRINNAYQASLQAAKTPEDESRVIEAATGEATQAITEKGLSVDKYKEILVVAQSNPEIADKIRRFLVNSQ